MRNGKSHSEAGKLGAIASLKTHNEQKQKRTEEYDRNPKLCECCGKSIDYDHRFNRFCSRSCAAKINNIGISRNRKDKLNSLCLNCNKVLIKSQKKFCSITCQMEYKWKAFKEESEKIGYFKPGFGNEARRPLVKKYLIEKYGHKCSICGIDKWMGKDAPLVVDHIDGNSTNCSIENFRLVCGNCDMQLPTYKSKNKFGRTWRKKYC